MEKLEITSVFFIFVFISLPGTNHLVPGVEIHEELK